MTNRMNEILEIATDKFIEFDASYADLAADETMTRADYFSEYEISLRKIRPIDDNEIDDCHSFFITLPYDCQIDIIALQIDDNPKTPLADAFAFHISADTCAYTPMIPQILE